MEFSSEYHELGIEAPCILHINKNLPQYTHVVRSWLTTMHLMYGCNEGSRSPLLDYAHIRVEQPKGRVTFLDFYAFKH